MPCGAPTRELAHCACQPPLIPAYGIISRRERQFSLSVCSSSRAGTPPVRRGPVGCAASAARSKSVCRRSRVVMCGSVFVLRVSGNMTMRSMSGSSRKAGLHPLWPAGAISTFCCRRTMRGLPIMDVQIETGGFDPWMPADRFCRSRIRGMVERMDVLPCVWRFFRGTEPVKVQKPSESTAAGSPGQMSRRPSAGTHLAANVAMSACAVHNRPWTNILCGSA